MCLGWEGWQVVLPECLGPGSGAFLFGQMAGAPFCQRWETALGSDSWSRSGILAAEEAAVLRAGRPYSG